MPREDINFRQIRIKEANADWARARRTLRAGACTERVLVMGHVQGDWLAGGQRGGEWG